LAAFDHQGVDVIPSAVRSDAASALLSAAADAELLVVGSRGHGGLAGLLLGSVSQKCVTHAACPVVVVPTGRGPIVDGASSQHPDLVADGTVRRIVVGLDGSVGSSSALRWALSEAARRTVPLVSVTAWPYADHDHAKDHGPEAPDLGEAKAALDDQLDAVGIASEIEVERHTPTEFPSLALLKIVRQDDLLVVGSRGRGGFTGLLLGSVSLHCVTHAPCAVAVVHRDGQHA
jgi:nucleotide-binding universal stress UspA family protein